MLDEGNREGLEIAMGLSLPSRRVTRTLDELVAVHGCPAAVRVDNGPEFTAQSFIDWGTGHGVAIHYIPAGQARSERVHRALQSELSDGGPQRASLRVGRRATGTDRHLVADLQQRTAPRQPRPGAAAHVSAEAFISRPVSLCRVYLTGKLTGQRARSCVGHLAGPTAWITAAPHRGHGGGVPSPSPRWRHPHLCPCVGSASRP